MSITTHEHVRASGLWPVIDGQIAIATMLSLKKPKELQEYCTKFIKASELIETKLDKFVVMYPEYNHRVKAIKSAFAVAGRDPSEQG